MKPEGSHEHKCSPLEPLLNYMNPVQIVKTYFFFRLI
jgi:hypothetical protein